VLSATIPIAVFLIAQLYLQSFVDFAAAMLGLTYSMVTGTCFQVILKKTIGGFRPHFLVVCKPVIPPQDGSSGAGYGSIMYTARQICTGDPWRVQNALESFPSGHAEVAFAGLGYLTIYLFTHLRITSRRDRVKISYWKMLLVVAPLFFATYLSSTLVLGYHHHWDDVVFGALIGWVMALLGYRMVFMAVTDGEWNTVPYLKLADVGGDRSGSPA
jgi:membrane-associated phospholipid phosphatase